MKTVLVGLVMLLSGFAAAQSAKSPYISPNGFIPDAKTACKVAEVLFEPIFGAKTVKHERPFTATLSGDTWIVRGTLAGVRDPAKRRQIAGGVAEIRLSRTTGQVLEVKHGL